MKKNKQKGFTLIELVAVILVLAIIALIAIPTIGNIIEESKKNTFKTSVQNIVKAATDQCEMENLKGEILTKSYSFSSTGAEPKLTVKGKLPTSGIITLDDECNVSVNISNDKYTATINDGVVVIVDKNN